MKKNLWEEKISFGGEYQLENARIDEFDQIFNIINTSYKEDDDFWVEGIFKIKKKKKTQKFIKIKNKGERIENVEELKNDENCFHTVKNSNNEIVALFSLSYFTNSSLAKLYFFTIDVK